MIIGVDAGALSVTDDRLKVGVWRVTFNLLKELSKLDRKNEYRLYSFLPIEKKLISEFGPGMKNVILRPKIGWFTLRLPLELRRQRIDLFLGLSQAIPLAAPKSLGFVYDLGFLHYPQAYPGSLRQLKKRTEELVRRTSRIVAISQTTADDLVQTYRYPLKNISVIYPGVDGRFTPTGPRFKSRYPYFLFVGALKCGKNIPFALRAYSQILKKIRIRCDFFIIGGDYWKDPEIEATIKQLHLKERVKLLGFVKDAGLPKYYRGAVALVTASLWEGFCLPAVEAMACGCPVIASSAGSLPEIVGKGGIIVDPKKEAELIRALEMMAEGKTKRQLMIANGLERAKNFSWTAFGNKVLEIINGL